jgi:hypothetical protein
MPKGKGLRSSESSGYRKGRMDMTEQEVNGIWDRIDDLLSAGSFTECDALLRETDTYLCSMDTILSLLTATLPAKGKLPSRDMFRRRSERTLRSRGEWDDGLFDGL